MKMTHVKVLHKIFFIPCWIFRRWLRWNNWNSHKKTILSRIIITHEQWMDYCKLCWLVFVNIPSCWWLIKINSNASFFDFLSVSPKASLSSLLSSLLLTKETSMLFLWFVEPKHPDGTISFPFLSFNIIFAQVDLVMW